MDGGWRSTTTFATANFEKYVAHHNQPLSITILLHSCLPISTIQNLFRKHRIVSGSCYSMFVDLSCPSKSGPTLSPVMAFRDSKGVGREEGITHHKSQKVIWPLFQTDATGAQVSVHWLALLQLPSKHPCLGCGWGMMAESLESVASSVLENHLGVASATCSASTCANHTWG